LSADYEQAQAALKARVAELQREMDKAREAAVNVDKFMSIVRRHTSFEGLTPTLLREFVEKIIVHESVATDGKRRGPRRIGTAKFFNQYYFFIRYKLTFEDYNQTEKISSLPERLSTEGMMIWMFAVPSERLCKICTPIFTSVSSLVWKNNRFPISDKKPDLPLIGPSGLASAQIA